MNYKYLILLIFFFAAEAQAADNLGRLFHTPEQRAQLDLVRAKRDQRQPLAPEPEPAITAAPKPQGPSAVTYSGVVRRSDGKSTVWINGKPVDERSRLSPERGINVLGMRSDGAVSLSIPEVARTATLRVGQRLDVNSGRIDETYVRRGATTQFSESAPVDGTHVISPRGNAESPSGKTPVSPRPENAFETPDQKSSSNTPPAVGRNQ